MQYASFGPIIVVLAWLCGDASWELEVGVGGYST